MKSSAIPLIVIALAAAGCAGNRGPSPTVAGWSMPWQLNPADVASAEKGEEYTSLYVPGSGIVRGTKAALSGIGRPLPSNPARNRTVATCRDTIAKEAIKIGARDVEAASMGPDRRGRDGNYTGLVLVRISYPRFLGYEIRQTAMTCTVSPSGAIVDAKAA